MKKILVTGGAGFIGSHLVDRLISLGHRVVIVDNLSNGSDENIPTNTTVYKMSIQDKEIEEVFAKERPEVVYHLAAQVDVRKSVEDPKLDASSNIYGSLHLFHHALKSGVKKIIFSSTGGAIYGETSHIPTPENIQPHPLSPYGIGKLISEYYLYYYYKNFGISYVILRYANVYGPRQKSSGEAGVVAIFCEKILKGETLTIHGDGKQTRDYVYIKDVIDANILAVQTSRVGIYNVGTQDETDVNTLALSLKKIALSDVAIVHGPKKLGEQERSCLNIKKIEHELEWHPTMSLTDGLSFTLAWYKKKMYDSKKV